MLLPCNSRLEFFNDLRLYLLECLDLILILFELIQLCLLLDHTLVLDVLNELSFLTLLMLWHNSLFLFGLNCLLPIDFYRLNKLLLNLQSPRHLHLPLLLDIHHFGLLYFFFDLLDLLVFNLFQLDNLDLFELLFNNLLHFDLLSLFLDHVPVDLTLHHLTLRLFQLVDPRYRPSRLPLQSANPAFQQLYSLFLFPNLRHNPVHL